MEEFWKIALSVAGLGAIATFFIWSLYKSWLNLPIFQVLTKKQLFILFVIFLVLSFLFALSALGAYVYITVENGNNEDKESYQEEKVNEYMGYIVTVSGNYERIDKYPNYLDRVSKEGEYYANLITGLDNNSLRIQYRLTKSGYGSLGYVLSALAEDRKSLPDSQRIMQLVNKGVTAISAFANERLRLSNPTQEWQVDTIEWLEEQQLTSLAKYNKATFSALRAKYGDGSKSSVFEQLSEIPRSYLGEHKITAEPIYQWLCSSVPVGESQPYCPQG